jgi:hypothetical protein
VLTSLPHTLLGSIYRYIINLEKEKGEKHKSTEGKRLLFMLLF